MNWFNEALGGLRKSGHKDLIVYCLLARAGCFRWHLSLCIVSDQESALQDLEEANSIANRSGMRRYLVDCHLESVRLALTIDRLVLDKTVAEHITIAKRLIEETGYKRRIPEVEYLEELNVKTNPSTLLH